MGSIQDLINRAPKIKFMPYDPRRIKYEETLIRIQNVLETVYGWDSLDARQWAHTHATAMPIDNVDAARFLYEGLMRGWQPIK